MDDEGLTDAAPAVAPEQPVDENAAELPVYEVPDAPETGDAAVDQAVLRLAAATSEALEHQVTAFDAAHRALQDRLADVES